MPFGIGQEVGYFALAADKFVNGRCVANSTRLYIVELTCKQVDLHYHHHDGAPIYLSIIIRLQGIQWPSYGRLSQ